MSNMAIISGQSIAAVSDSVTRNGKGNTAFGVMLIVIGSATILSLPFVWGWVANNSKRKNATQLANTKRENSENLAKTKHELKMEEMERKAELEKEKAEYKAKLKQQTIALRYDTSQRGNNFNPDVEPSYSDDSDVVPTYDELVSGDVVDSCDIRMGLRCFHIGHDNGLIGRSNAGKTSFLFHFAKAVCTNSQEDGAILTPDWCLHQPMKVLYFAFEQSTSDFKVKYAKFIKSIPNLHVDTQTSANDFQSIMKKIKNMQSKIGEYRLLVIFDNITKMKNADKKEKKAFFQWLEDYRTTCEKSNKPITYLKAYHTQGTYKDYMPIEITSNYGLKTDTYFTTDLVGFGVCKGGDGKLRYLKELKNKSEADAEKPTVSVYRFADTLAPMYDYVEEAIEVDVLPTKADMVRRGSSTSSEITINTPCRRGPKEKYTETELREMHEEKAAGFSWREILESRGIQYQKNKVKGITKAMRRYNIIGSMAA